MATARIEALAAKRTLEINKQAEQIPLRGPGKGDDLGVPVVFQAGDKFRYITCQVNSFAAVRRSSPEEIGLVKIGMGDPTSGDEPPHGPPMSYGLFSACQIERDIDDHVFLTPDHLAAADFGQDRAGIEAMVLRRLFGVAQER